MSPYLPITTDEIISQDVAAAEASAVLHLHPRDEKDRQAQSDHGSVRALPAADQAAKKYRYKRNVRRQSLHESGGTGKGRQRIITGGYWVAAQSASSQMMPAGIVLQCGISKIARVAAW
jgi:hypothetical protein